MSQPHVSRAAWEEAFKGFEIIGVAIRNASTIQTVAKKALTPEDGSRLLNEQVLTRIASVFLDDLSPENTGHREISGMRYPKVGVSRTLFHEGALLASMDRDGDVYPVGGGVDGPFEKIAPDGWPGLKRLKCLWGYTYSVGGSRDIYKRVAVGKWERDSRIPEPKTYEAIGAAGFNDLDAFSESDMYAVGGHGDVWHFDGSAWRQMGFPTNEQLATVTCAGDGNVYITGEGGSLWVGQKSTWRLLEQRGSSVLCNDAVWFNGQLWMASDYQLRVWNGKAVVPPEHDGKPILASGHMDAYDGLLAVADLWTVSTFDGQQWRTVVAPYKD
jgi:hypothetical protein